MEPAGDLPAIPMGGKLLEDGNEISGEIKLRKLEHGKAKLSVRKFHGKNDLGRDQLSDIFLLKLEHGHHII